MMRFAMLGGVLTGILMSLVLTASARPGPQQYEEAQSTFRFRTNPEFMLLTVYPGGLIDGYTASFWQKDTVSFILGKAIAKNSIELSFYPESAEELAYKKLAEADQLGKCGLLDDHSCYLSIIRTILSELPLKPFQTSIFRLKPATKEWAREHTIGSPVYSNFVWESDYDLPSFDAVVSNSAKANVILYHEWTPVGDLFESHIVRSYAGLPSSEDIVFKTQYCDKISTGLLKVLRDGGHWDVQISPEHQQSYQVRFKSHSSRQFFYRDGYWWKVFVEIAFSHEDRNGTCSQAKVYLYDSVVCGGPLTDDPDSSGRSQCFQRIDSDSKAEIDFRDHLTQIIQAAYGKPDKN